MNTKPTKKDEAPEDFETWKLIRGTMEETHQAEFALKGARPVSRRLSNLSSTPIPLEFYVFCIPSV